MRLLLDDNHMKSMMAKYGATPETLTNDHAFVTDYLLPMLQRISDDITGIHDVNNPKHTTVSINIIGRNDSHTSWHDYPEYKTMLSYEPTLPSQRLADSTFHETEHANQTLGRGYSHDERILITLARLHYSEYGPAYYNNYTELRARLESARVYIERCSELKANPTATLDDKVTLTSAHSGLRDHLLEELDVSETDKWIEACQKHIRHIHWYSSSKEKAMLMQAFPDAKNLTEAKEQALIFLRDKAPTLFKECVEAIHHAADSMDILEAEVSQEKAEHEQHQRNERVIELAKEHGVPILDTMPTPAPVSQNTIDAETKLERLFSETTKMFNRAIVMTNNTTCMVADVMDNIYRDYAHPRPPELTPKSSPETDSHGHDTTGLDVSAEHHHEIDDLEELDWDTL